MTTRSVDRDRTTTHPVAVAPSADVDRALDAAGRWRERAFAREQAARALDQGRYTRADGGERLGKWVARREAWVREHERPHAGADIALDGVLDATALPLRIDDVTDERVERVIGAFRDLLSIEFLELGLRAARSVGRVVIPGATATGFLVAPGVMITNHHVLPDEQVAAAGELELNYEDNRVGEPQPLEVFRLRPDVFYLAVEALDVALVGVHPTSARGTDLGAFASLALIEEEGKARIGEAVNIIQHPGGRAKQVVVRDNRLVDLPTGPVAGEYCHYQADTQPGSSGSPVFNDLWEVVALHHTAVPATNAQGQLLDADGAVLRAGEEARIAWIANEGVRVSRIVRAVRSADVQASMAPVRDACLRAWGAAPAPTVERTPARVVPVGSNRSSGRLSYADFKARLMDVDVPDHEIAAYLNADPSSSGALDPRVVLDPAKVDLGPEARFDQENALRWANAANRWRRHARFQRRAEHSTAPVLVSEGDSWFQLPFLVDDVVDHLDDRYLVWSLDAAGDTAETMVARRPEYMKGLDEQRHRVRAFLFSAAGNDIIGEDALGEPVLRRLVKTHRPGEGAAWHIDRSAFDTVLGRLEALYRRVVTTIRSDADLTTLPILVHGYDHALPGGAAGDQRAPAWAAQDKWLGSPLRSRGIEDPSLQREVVRLLIDELYEVLHRVAADDPAGQVHVVDVRGTLTSITDWVDEIHATNKGFAHVAARFEAVLRSAGVHPGRHG